MIDMMIDKTHKIYAEVLEAGALEQFRAAMACDFSLRGALMPDAHQGYSLPIGGVVETDSFVLPSWVGYDIGCGMCAVRTKLTRSDLIGYEDAAFAEIMKAVPVGKHKRSGKDIIRVSGLSESDLTDRGRDAFDARGGWSHMGTLGGGNHFIEVGYDDNDGVWIVIHSGSRGVGHGIATAYMRLASPDGKAREGHYGFDIASDNGLDYINDLNWALDFALANRKAMIDETLKALHRAVTDEDPSGVPASDWFINRNHNHAEIKDGKVIHRKGATHAEDGMSGVIPGNMRDGSFVVVGKGCEDALWSSSHGAGRVLSRSKAKAMLDMDTFIDQMEGIVGCVDQSRLDESPDAYKSIFDVMDAQKDLVEVVTRIRPIVNVKG